jgi:hypothetical protein
MRFASLALLLFTACGSVKQDFDDICHAEERAGVTAQMNPAEKAVTLAKWLQERLRTDEAKRFLGTLATHDPSEKGELLRKTAAQHGVSPCPIADSTWGK